MFHTKTCKNRNLAVYLTDSSFGMNIFEDTGNCESFADDKIAIPLAHSV